MKKIMFMTAGTAVAVAGLVLTGCGTDPVSGSGPEATATSESVTEVDFDGDYVLAADGGLFTLTFTGTEVQVTRQICVVEQPDPEDEESEEPDETESPSPSEKPLPSPSEKPSDSVTTDPRDSGFGELEKPEGEPTATITWFDGGSYTDEDTTTVEALSDGAILRLGENTFHSATGTQGRALQDQFEVDCATGGPTKEPSDEPSDDPSPSGEPSDDPSDEETSMFDDDEGDDK
ncbi:MAG: hypothetical protein ACTH2Q_01475 [Propionibacteriaceae bacterium]